ncbi:MAG: ltaA [Planctomycetaceae bacterium]|nr:ltaA [Planctomycetaceae bacterium]
MTRTIDMRSDTVTKPTPEMRAAMANAVVGDDMNGEDPTVNRLEEMCCKLFAKEAAVYCCSGTQSNQMAVWAHCHSGDELLIEAGGHIASFEGGAPAALSGVTCRTIPGRNGLLDLADLEGKIRADNQHLARTRLVCVENTANVGGGTYYSLSALERIGRWAHANDLRVHMDGARVFNAVIASGNSPAEICEHIDSISVCFSKGLGCPMGSILIGSKDVIYRARRARKLFGGALRQAGIVAASAVYALENNVQRMQVDHDNAKLFATEVAKIPGIKLDAANVQSNLVFFEVDSQLGNAAQLSYALKQHGVLMGATGGGRLRAVTHLDVTRDDMLAAAKILGDCVKAGFSDCPGTAAGPYARG